MDDEFNVIDAMRKKGMKLLDSMCIIVYILMATIMVYTFIFDTPEANKSNIGKYAMTTLMAIFCYVIQSTTHKYPHLMQYAPLLLMSFNMIFALERDF